MLESIYRTSERLGTEQPGKNSGGSSLLAGLQTKFRLKRKVCLLESPAKANRCLEKDILNQQVPKKTTVLNKEI